MKIRKEVPSDAVAIEAVIIAAFENAAHTEHTEQFIVRELRKFDVLSVSLVAEDDSEVIGHVAVSPVTISDGSTGWFGLGPLSVSPERQGGGVGTRLVERALSELRALGAVGCVVLGRPAYYSRFGFTAEPSLVLPGVRAENFQAVSFNGSLPSGTVAYHRAFATKA